MKKSLIILSTGLLSFVTTAYATTVNLGTAGAGSAAGTSLLNLINTAQQIVTRLAPLFIGAAVIVFFYFLIMFIMRGSESGEKRGEYMKGMAFAVLALFVMVSIWGLVGVLQSFFGVGGVTAVPQPCLPGPTGDCVR